MWLILQHFAVSIELIAPLPIHRPNIDAQAEPQPTRTLRGPYLNRCAPHQSPLTTSVTVDTRLVHTSPPPFLTQTPISPIGSQGPEKTAFPHRFRHTLRGYQLFSSLSGVSILCKAPFRPPLGGGGGTLSCDPRCHGDATGGGLPNEISIATNQLSTIPAQPQPSWLSKARLVSCKIACAASFLPSPLAIASL